MQQKVSVLPLRRFSFGSQSVCVVQSTFTTTTQATIIQPASSAKATSSLFTLPFIDENLLNTSTLTSHSQLCQQILSNHHVSSLIHHPTTTTTSNKERLIPPSSLSPFLTCSTSWCTSAQSSSYEPTVSSALQRERERESVTSHISEEQNLCHFRVWCAPIILIIIILTSTSLSACLSKSKATV